MTPKVHIVMRTKDRPHFLPRACHDVLAQSFEDWRLTIVNDGGAVEPVDELMASLDDDRIRVIHHENSAGMEAASNAGVASEDSEYVVIHDDDDTWHPEFLARTTQVLDAAPDEVVAVAVRTEIVYERIDGDTIVEEGRGPFVPELRGLFLVDFMRSNRAVPISILYRRSVHDLFWYSEDLPAVGDWAFNLKLLMHGRIDFLDGDPLAYWHQRPQATGADGNSIFGASADHVRCDRNLRDEELRSYVDAHGLGLPLLLGHSFAYEHERMLNDVGYLLDERERRLNERIADLEAKLEAVSGRVTQLRDELHTELPDRIADHSFYGLLRQRYRTYLKRR